MKYCNEKSDIIRSNDIDCILSPKKNHNSIFSHLHYNFEDPLQFKKNSLKAALDIEKSSGDYIKNNGVLSRYSSKNYPLPNDNLTLHSTNYFDILKNKNKYNNNRKDNGDKVRRIKSQSINFNNSHL